MVDTQRRVGLVTNGTEYAGPALARAFAQNGYNVVIADPADGLVDELKSAGVDVVDVKGATDMTAEGNADKMVKAALDAFGRLDSATSFGGDIMLGAFLDSSIEDLRSMVVGGLEAPYRFLKAVTRPMVEARSGQILVIASATGMKPYPNAAIYSTVRAAAVMLAKSVAVEVAYYGVQVNAIGTHFMNFPGFDAALGTADPVIRHQMEQLNPEGRFGSMEGFANLCLAFLDGKSDFVTGQMIANDGGWTVV
ncbi:MAG: SDR family oxidoreductase [Actinobacteria bacterium]|nr:SDR family oxidoreductase [Actinomycetota bacterium]MCB9389477.1 SDR family oxidoreductase [Acidimicrobiia bacterium]